MGKVPEQFIQELNHITIEGINNAIKEAAELGYTVKCLTAMSDETTRRLYIVYEKVE